jgi:copper transport protein
LTPAVAAMRIILFLLASLLGMVEGGSSAFAHASLLQSMPADGDVLLEAPRRFVLTFNEPVSPVVMRLIDPDGVGSELSKVETHDEAVVIEAPPLKTGTHALSWRVLSADGHPVGGSIVFSIGAPSASTVPVQANPPPALVAAIWLARVLLYVGLFVGVGARFFVAWIAPRQPLPRSVEDTVDVCLAAGLVAAIASLGLQGLDALGADFPRLADARIWATALNTSYALTLGIAASALALALASRRVGSVPVKRGTTALAIFAVGLALAASGHASDAPPQTLTRPAIFIHGVCIAFWIGSLLPLSALARDSGTPAADALTRFSRIIPIPVALLVASGGLLATVQIAHVAALWTTVYGRIFDAKIMSVVVLLGIAGWNRFRLTPRVQAGESDGRRAIARSIAVETVFVAIILSLVATWRFTPPPRSLLAALPPLEPSFVHVMNAQLMANITITPGQSGPVKVAIAIESPELQPFPAKGVSLALVSPAAGIEPIHRAARQASDGNWSIDDLTIPRSGRWLLTVSILVTDFQETSLTTPVDLAR